MAQVAQTLIALRSILVMLDSDGQQAALQKLVQDFGMQQTDVPRMYSDRDIAERYGVHVKTVRAWIASGRLKGCQIDRYWYSRADWLDKFDMDHAISEEGGEGAGRRADLGRARSV